jgi:hypothetical protein
MLNGVPFFNALSLVKVVSVARKGQQQSRHERQRNAGFSNARRRTLLDAHHDLAFTRQSIAEAHVAARDKQPACERLPLGRGRVAGGGWRVASDTPRAAVGPWRGLPSNRGSERGLRSL